MFIRTLVALVCVLVPAAVAAQSSSIPSGPLTLGQTLALAESTSETIAAAQAGVRRAEGEQTRARSGRYPQATALATYDRALASEFSGVFDDSFFGGGDTDAGDPDLSALPFGRENTWRFSISVSQSVYSGGRLGALRDIAAAGRLSSDLALNAARAQLLFDVTQAYYDAALSDQLVAIADATVGQADATLQQVQASFNAGAMPEFELLRARVNRDNQRPALIRQRAARDVAYLRLKQLLELPAEYDLQLADRLSDEALALPPPFAEAFVKMAAVAEIQAGAPARQQLPALTDRNAVREVGALVRLREASLQAARAERRPAVTATSNFAQIAYPSGPFPAGDFRTNWTIGASLQVPLLTGGRLGAEQRVAQADLDQSRAQLRQTEELAALDTRAAWAELTAAQAAWEASSGTIQQAARAYEIATVRFNAGVSTQLELSDARLLLQQSETNRAQAARDLQVARARLALLPDLPLVTSGARTSPAPTTTAPIAPQALPGLLRNAATAIGATQTGGRQ